MFQRIHTSRNVGVGAALFAVGFWLLAGLAPSPAQPKGGKAALRASDEIFGYTAAFDQELAKIGQITPQQFAQRYVVGADYAKGLSWDPTTAKFWDAFQADPAKKNGGFDFRLNDKELAAFKKNGFVVSERMGAASFGEMYYQIYSRDLPVYISADSILHAWHRTYDAMLEQLEEKYLAESLGDILASMAAKIPAAEKDYGSGVLADSVKDADYFLAVARSLLTGNAVKTELNQDERLAKTLALVEKLGAEKFKLFGRERDVDFSQFKVRGHYENSELLKKYFKAMMWCGRTDLRIAGGK